MRETVEIDVKSKKSDPVPCCHAYEGASQLSSPPLIRRQNHMIIVTMRARKHTNVSPDCDKGGEPDANRSITVDRNFVGGKNGKAADN